MTSISTLTDQVKKVMEQYRKDFPDVHMDRDYAPLKLTEEWGECMQVYLMLTKRGRQKGKTEEEIQEMLREEIADVFGYLLLFAEQENIDLSDALEKKWFTHIKE